MFPIYDLEGINDIESEMEGSHVILLLFVKPSDKNADDILRLLNYWNRKSERYCSIYLIGYSQNFMKKYMDVRQIESINGEIWEYSDKCFIDVCNQLRKRLKNWNYSGEPELIILQSMCKQSSNKLDFRGYSYIDINYGIKKGYIDSFPRFMERLLNACMVEVDSRDAVARANRSRIKCKNVIEEAINSAPKLPKGIKTILKDKLFYKTFKNKDNFWDKKWRI